MFVRTPLEFMRVYPRATLILAFVIGFALNRICCGTADSNHSTENVVSGQEDDDDGCGGEKPKKAKKSGTVRIFGEISAYTSTPDQTDNDPFIAASNKHVYDGMVANNRWPFGTKIRIPELFGDKVFTVDDRMNSRYGPNNFDIWMDASKEEAMKFGRKNGVLVEITLE